MPRPPRWRNVDRSLWSRLGHGPGSGSVRHRTANHLNEVTWPDPLRERRQIKITLPRQDLFVEWQTYFRPLHQRFALPPREFAAATALSLDKNSSGDTFSLCMAITSRWMRARAFDTLAQDVVSFGQRDVILNAPRVRQGGKLTSGFGPSLFHAPKYFSTAAFATGERYIANDHDGREIGGGCNLSAARFKLSNLVNKSACGAVPQDCGRRPRRPPL